MASANNNTFSYDDSKVPNGKDLRIALIVAQWNKTITDKLFQGAKKTLLEHEKYE